MIAVDAQIISRATWGLSWQFRGTADFRWAGKMTIRHALRHRDTSLRVTA